MAPCKARILLLAVIIFLAMTGAGFAANLDTSFIFSTIETDHFSIHFHQGMEDIAQKAAAVAEDAHARLTILFKWTPREKTQIIIIDDSDYANGSAGVLPYNVIYVQAAPPALDTTIGEYDDWLSILIIHEYTHIVTMDSARGYSKAGRKVFGKSVPGGDPLSLLTFIATAPPNVFLPRWWLEGAATWSETGHTLAGRGRSAFYEMIYRTAVAENNLPPVDQINGEMPDWPNGHSPYIYGLRLQKYIADTYGTDALGRLSIAHAGRFPYLINGVAERTLGGKNYVTIYYEMLADLRREEREQIVILKQTPLTPFNEFALDGELLTNPRWSPDNRLVAYNRRDPHGHEAVWLANKDGTNAHEAVRRRHSDHSLSWSPDGAKLYFTQAEVYNGFDVYSDLYSYELKNGCVERLTKGMRVMEADVSPDGKMIAAITGNRGSRNLAILEKESTPSSVAQGLGPAVLRKHEKYLLKTVTDYKYMRPASPRWSPDGGRIAYALTDNNGRGSLRVYDVKTQKDVQLLEGAFEIAYPSWSKDGRYIVFTSDETNVFNLYAYSLEDGQRRQLSHVLGGAFQPDVSSNGNGADIVFSSYHSTGFKLATMPFDATGISVSPAIKPYWKDDPAAESNGSATPGYNTEAKTLPVKPYSASKTILPRFWLPTLTSDKDGAVLGAFTVGQDALAYNTYLLEAGYGLNSNAGYYNAVYHNDYTYPTLIAASSSKPVLYADLAGMGDYYERQTSVTLTASVPLNRLEAYHRLTFGYQLFKQGAQSELANGRFGSLSVFEGRRDNVFIKLDFSSSLKYPYSISREEGKDASIVYRYYSKAVGSDVHSKEFTASLSEYLSLPFKERLRHSVLYLNLKGGVSSGERITQQAFQLGGTSGQSDFGLRGFPARSSTGKFVGTSTLELRSPVKYVFEGVNTKPFFMEKLHGAIFMDAGETWDDDTGFAVQRLRVGGGAELRLDMTLGYMVAITPAIGVARGFNKDGTTQVYFAIYSNL